VNNEKNKERINQPSQICDYLRSILTNKQVSSRSQIEIFFSQGYIENK